MNELARAAWNRPVPTAAIVEAGLTVKVPSR